uniref:Putative secreted protein n=1 Tax=Ixodes ricinus TaxID=34613 RepID=A0A6B0U847_IXORI
MRITSLFMILISLSRSLVLLIISSLDIRRTSSLSDSSPSFQRDWSSSVTAAIFLAGLEIFRDLTLML